MNFWSLFKQKVRYPHGLVRMKHGIGNDPEQMSASLIGGPKKGRRMSQRNRRNRAGRKARGDPIGFGITGLLRKTRLRTSWYPL